MKKILFILFILAISFLSSCVPYKEQIYLQGTTNKQFTDTLTLTKAKIQSNDYLYIKITASDDVNWNSMISSNTTGAGLSSGSMEFISYLVNDSGFIKLPFIGSVLVKEKELIEIEKLVEEKLSQYLVNPIVSVRQVNRFYCVLGEAKMPGRYEFNRDNLTIFQALSQAGDLNYYGDKTKVKIVRAQKSSVKIAEINLTDASVFNSEYYTIKNGDLIYILPHKRKKWGINTIPSGLTIASTAVTFMLLILTLTK